MIFSRSRTGAEFRRNFARHDDEVTARLERQARVRSESLRRGTPDLKRHLHGMHHAMDEMETTIRESAQ